MDAATSIKYSMITYYSENKRGTAFVYGKKENKDLKQEETIKGQSAFIKDLKI